MKLNVTNLLLALSLCFILNSCDQLSQNKDRTVRYSQLTPEKNYWDSIPGKVKVRDKNRPYRYYLDNKPYTGKVEDFYSSGRPKLKGAFKDGYAEGPWIYYQHNDSVDQAGSFENGYVIGEWKFYDRFGKMDTKLRYHSFHDKRSYITADTLFVRYEDDSKKEFLPDKVICTYPNGQKKSEISNDGATGTLWDKNGKVIATMKDFVLKDLETNSVTYFIAKGKNVIAYQELIKKHQWTEQQKEAFKNANKVKVSASGYMSTSSYGFEVRMD